MAKGPLCRYCGKPIAKKTHTVYFGKEAGSFASPYSTNRPEYPASKQEAQRLLNQEVVSLRWSRGEDYYAKKAGHDFICQVSTWDGESYVDEFFCNGEHARLFGYAAARSGRVAMKAYNDAVNDRRSTDAEGDADA